MAKGLTVPANVALLHLPPYAPELNGAERIWAYLRSHYLSNRIHKDHDELFEVIKVAWNRRAISAASGQTDNDLRRGRNRRTG